MRISMFVTRSLLAMPLISPGQWDLLTFLIPLAITKTLCETKGFIGLSQKRHLWSKAWCLVLEKVLKIGDDYGGGGKSSSSANFVVDCQVVNSQDLAVDELSVDDEVGRWQFTPHRPQLAVDDKAWQSMSWQSTMKLADEDLPLPQVVVDCHRSWRVGSRWRFTPSPLPRRHR